MACVPLKKISFPVGLRKAATENVDASPMKKNILKHPYRKRRHKIHHFHHPCHHLEEFPHAGSLKERFVHHGLTKNILPPVHAQGVLIQNAEAFPRSNNLEEVRMRKKCRHASA